MASFNPRFPHSFRVLRARVNNGSPVVSSNGTPVYDEIPMQKVVTIDGLPVRDWGGNSFVTEDVEQMSFGYRTDSRSTSVSGDVVNTNLVLHCPMFIGEINFDDILEITDYDGTYKARAIRKTTFNFGTAIWIDKLGN